MLKSPLTKGASLVEILVAAFVVSVALTALLGAYSFFLKLALANTASVQSAFLLEEGQEVMRLLRDSGWTAKIQALTPGTNYELSFDQASNSWTTVTTPVLIDGFFERKVVVANVYRDSNNNIVTTGGTLDPQTKKISVTVAWPTATGTATTSVATYLTNVFNN